ncbi:hypothetical protein C0Q70_14479 [Pomacea canaliculata]|uniref:Uncharacterized protein n=1 Tax=Pomacea canaliculata TaxID=400727 RepID=A0A2T7P047_POMCA|nr:hypothetical protein C0Q70_14479 [Pomacea canaliculata]
MSVPGLGLTVPVRDEGGEPEVASAGVEARRLGEGRGENIMLELRDAVGQVGGVDNSRTHGETSDFSPGRPDLAAASGPRGYSSLFGYFQSGVEEEDMTVGEEVSVFMVSKRRRVGEAAGDRKRRDSVQTLKFVPLLDSYLAASQKGAITVWSSKLRLQACVDLNEPAWVTGCDFLPNLRRVACCTERSLAVWDNRAKGNSQSVFILKPIEHSPQCMTYMPGPQFSDEHEDTILFGDDQGYINVLNLVAKDLTMKNSKGEGRNSFNMTIEPSKLTHPIVRRKIHGDWVLKVKYFPDLRCFASCSPSSHVSFVLEEPERLYDNGEVRGVSVPKGVNCFDYCVRANIIATGGVDKIIRVWHPHIFSRPTGKLMGHLFTVIDIVCNERDQHIISLSTARVFRVWDIHTLTCLQVFTDNEERPGEKRIYSMLFDNKNERLLTGSSVIDAWPLTRAVQDTMQVPHTHDRPLVQILTNKDLNQIVSVCTESVIKVWEMDTGKLVYSISEAHGPNVEVTALALDNSGYRLASGAFDGSLKVWDFGAGQCIKCKAGRSTDEDLSITGLVYQRFYDDHVIVASGWTNKIKLVLDSKDNTDLTILREFNDVYFWTREVSITSTSSSSSSMASAILPDIGQPSSPVTSVFRKDFLLTNHEVTCMTAITSDVMATGCGNGNIIFWNVERAVVEKIFLLPPSQNSSARSRHRMRQAGERRVNCMRVLVHRVRRLDPAYIKKLTGNYRSGTEETKEDDNKSQETGRRSKRSVVAIGQGPDGQLDEDSKRLLRELSSSLGGKEQQAQDIVQDSAVQTRSESQGEDKIQQEASNTNTEEKPDTKDGEKTDVKTEAHDDGTGAWGLDSGDPDAKMIVDIFDPILVTVHHDAFVRFWDLECGGEQREDSLDSSASIVAFIFQPPMRQREPPLFLMTSLRWQPFRRSAYMAKKHEVLRPEDKKFFGALIKPRAYNDHLESFTTGEKTSGAVFRALPVYRIKTPKKPKTPDVSLKQNNEEEKNMFGPSSIFGITQAIKAPATKITGRRSHHTRLPVLAASASALNGTGLTLSPVSRPR